MLSTIVFCDSEAGRAAEDGFDPVKTLVRTLGSLITANVEGLLRDVAIAGPPEFDLHIIADHAGCRLVEAGREEDWIRLALHSARGPDVLLLRSGRAPELGFIEEAGDFLMRRRGYALGGAKNGGEEPTARLRTASLRSAPESLVERLFPSLAPVAGLIAPRELCLQAPAGGFGALAQFVRPATILRTRARRIV